MSYSDKLAFIKELRELGASLIRLNGEDVQVSFGPVARELPTREPTQLEKPETPADRRARIYKQATGG